MIGSAFGTVAALVDALSEFVWFSLSRALAGIVARAIFGGTTEAVAWL